MHEKLNLSTGSPVKIKWCDYDYFKYPLHFHSEYEIVYILKSYGKRFVGNSIKSYIAEDLVLIGSLVPHMYKSHLDFYFEQPPSRVHAITLQFSQDFFYHSIGNYPEFHKIKKMLAQSQYGISFPIDPWSNLIREKIKTALKLTGVELLVECINILHRMSNAENKYFLNHESQENHIGKLSHDPRIIKVSSYLQKHYTEEISLEEIADRAGMNKSAFCRFFKEKTSKSCFEYINELRVSYACKLLREGSMTITQICFEVGFNNISNFNRQFRKITQFTPTEYVHEFKKAKRR